MATETGKAFVISRLANAPDPASLQRVWESIGRDYRQDPDVVEFKSKLDGKAGNKMGVQTFILRGPDQREASKKWIDRAPDNARVVITDAKEDRTSQQNRTLHMWYGEIARQQADLDATEVKGICHREWGLTIKLRCPQFAWIWKQTGAQLPYEKQCKLLASGVLNVSSSMSVDELSEYMDGVFRRFTSDGVHLTDPELRKYEEAS